MRDRVGECLEIPVRSFELADILPLPLLQCCVVEPQPAHVERPRNDRQNDIQPEGLEDVVERTDLHRFDCGIDRAMSRHHDAGEIRIDLARRVQQTDTVHLGHHEIRQ